MTSLTTKIAKCQCHVADSIPGAVPRCLCEAVPRRHKRKQALRWPWTAIRQGLPRHRNAKFFFHDDRGYDKCDPTTERQGLPQPEPVEFFEAGTSLTPKTGTPRSATTMTRVQLLPRHRLLWLPPRHRLPRLLRLRTNDYDDYFPSGPKTMAFKSEDPSIRCVTPTLNPIYHICVFCLKSCIIN